MENKPFEPLAYFKMLAEKNRLCRKHGFKAVFASGPDNIEGIMNEFRRTQNFIVIDDTTDNNVHSNKPGWFTKSVYTVWVLAGTTFNNHDDRAEKMDLCRRIFWQFLSKMIRDKAKLVYGEGMYYLATERIYYKELGRYSFNGATGLYFMIENDVPTNLIYNAEEWEE